MKEYTPDGSQGALWDGASWTQQVQVRPGPSAQYCHDSCVLLPGEAHSSKALIKLSTIWPAAQRIYLSF